MSLNDWAQDGVSTVEAKELRAFAVELRAAVVEWLAQKHPRVSPWRK